MGMSSGQGKGARSAINVTPLIDVLLVLLIIFMVIQPNLQRGLEALAPQPPKDPGGEPNPETIVVQVLRDPDLGDQAPILAAVGPMQFEVASHRLDQEFGAPTELSPTSWRVARLTDEASTPTLRGLQGVAVYLRSDGTRYALFESPYWMAR